MDDLIDAYYTVARDMESRAKQMLYMAETIASLADQMSEAQMRQKQPAEGKRADEVKP